MASPTKPARSTRSSVRPSARPPVRPSGDYGEAFPNSKKIWIEGPHGIRVPMREIALSGGEPPLRVYDTSGPQGFDVREGLPSLRRDWIASRPVTLSAAKEPARRIAALRSAGPPVRPPLRGHGPLTQLHYARRGEVTPEMEFIAIREGMPAEFVRSEVARGRAIIPANINHPELEPMIIGRNFQVKINANIGNSAGQLVDRGGSREAQVGDIVGRRHGDGSLHRQEHPRDPGVDHPELGGADRDGADLPGAGEGGRRSGGPDLGDIPRHPDRAGRAGRGLLHRARRRAAALHPAHRQPGHRHRLPRRLHHGQVVPVASPGKLPLHPLPRDLRDHGGVRRLVLAGRRAPPGQHRRRQRRGPVRRAENPGRAQPDRLGARACR